MKLTRGSASGISWIWRGECIRFHLSRSRKDWTACEKVISNTWSLENLDLTGMHIGDEPAVFGVTFSGSLPFSFTYTRSEQSGSRSKVVETQVRVNR